MISPNESTGIADINIRLAERKRGKWSLSGPVGLVSIGGPLQAALTERLPWLPTFTASFNLIALARPIVPVIPVKKFMPVALLERPFEPGNGWFSGFVIVPQLGWSITAMSYGAAQLRQRSTPALEGDRGLIAELPVIIATRRGDRTMFCEPPNPRFWPLRPVAVFGLQLLAALPTL